MTGRNRIIRSVAAAVVLLLAMALVGACGSSNGSTSQGTTGGTGTGGSGNGAGRSTIKVGYLAQDQSRALVTGAGYPLYIFVPDHRQRVTCVQLCAASWPPLRSPAGRAPTVETGVRRSLLGADADAAGGSVVTYDRWPLYTYAADLQPGFATGQGVDVNGGYWYVIRPDGTPIVPSGEPPATGVPAT